MLGAYAYRRPLVVMLLICHGAYKVLYVSVGAIKVLLLELFYYYILLYLYALLSEGKSHHAVRFEPEGCLYIGAWQGDVVVGEVITCPCIVFSTGQLHVGVIVGDMYGALKHQMLQQMGISCACRVFIASTHIVQHVHCYHLCGSVFVVYYT